MPVKLRIFNFFLLKISKIIKKHVFSLLEEDVLGFLKRITSLCERG